jgi:peroxiredoxin
LFCFYVDPCDNPKATQSFHSAKSITKRNNKCSFITSVSEIYYMKKIRGFLLMILVTLSVPSHAQDTTIKPGSVAPLIKLKNIDDRQVSFNDYPAAMGFILVFICNTCPYSKAYEQRIMELSKKYLPRQYPLFAINPNDPLLSPGDSFENMKAHARSQHYTFPYLFDNDQKITSLYGPKCTPFVFVLSKNGDAYIVEYTGAIDNDIQQNSPNRINYAEDAINALIENRKPSIPATKAIGCSIARKKKQEL